MDRLQAIFGFAGRAIVIGLAAAFVILVFKPELIAPAPRTVAALPPAAVASYADAVEATSHAVVNIYTARSLPDADEPRSSPLPELPPLERIENSLGSGVIVTEGGYVLTNEHVVRDAESIHVALNDGRVTRALLMGTDRDTDLALLQVELDYLQPIEFGQSDELRIGDVVLAIGNPFGIGQTVTQGIVSAKGRTQLRLSAFENFIQTDASINPGNSGGALVDTRGRLVGINTAVFSRSDGSEGIGFAIPVNLARGVMDQLIEHGRVIRGWLGVNALDLSPTLSQMLGVETGTGILLTGVFPNGPASQAGLQVGDVILGLDDRPIANLQDALNRIARLSPGTPVTLKATRNGMAFEVEATVIERPSGPRGS